jgi:hypothetical protein
MSDRFRLALTALPVLGFFAVGGLQPLGITTRASQSTNFSSVTVQESE